MLIRHYHYPANSSMDSHYIGIKSYFFPCLTQWFVLQPSIQIHAPALFLAHSIYNSHTGFLSVSSNVNLFIPCNISHLKCPAFRWWHGLSMPWLNIILLSNNTTSSERPSWQVLNVSPIVFTLPYFFFVFLLPLDSIGYILICLLSISSAGKISMNNDFCFCFPYIITKGL